MNLSQITDALRNASVAYLIVVNSEGVIQVLCSDMDEQLAIDIIVGAMDTLYENELTDNNAPNVLTTWVGANVNAGMN